MASYHVCNQIMPCVQHYQDLGVVFDSKLRILNHIDYIISKSMKNLSTRIIRMFNDITNILKTYFLSFVLPISDYGSPIRSMVSDSNILRLGKTVNSSYA